MKRFTKNGAYGSRFLFSVLQVTTRSGSVSERKRSVDTRDGGKTSDTSLKAKKAKGPKARDGQLSITLDGSLTSQPALKQEDGDSSSRAGAKKHPPLMPSATGQSGPPIFTVGHGTRKLRELIDVLHSAGVTKLADVRSIPRSRKNPQFNRETLQTTAELQAAGIEYLWLGEQLGGRRNKKQPGVERHTAIRVDAFRNYAGYMSTPIFWEGLAGLENIAKEMENGSIAFMCSETLWWKCHRRMISDTLAIRGWDVRHLGVQKEPAAHRIWDIVRMNDDGELIYDVD